MLYGDGPYSSQPYSTANPAAYSLEVVETATGTDVEQSPIWVDIPTTQVPGWTDIPTY